ncbi:hypothetical protein [Variovorax terrae]|uniref:Lipoprotein n=1 Tax=Variovorax terrae TaxID=2923278 RepID=A0A9X2APX6_9BURK|nr:hypothetical protein [Variovorax terrae]MCJ0765365.1 hypothetical protein [Variovorax terrae]
MKGFLRSVLAAAVAVGLAGCGASGKPSESDAKQQIKRGFENCDVISVGSFEKTNGVAQRDGSYTLYVKFTLKGAALKKNKKLVEQYSARLEELKPLNQAFNDRLQALMDDRDALSRAHASFERWELANQKVEKYLNENGKVLEELRQHEQFFSGTGPLRQTFNANLEEACRVQDFPTSFFNRLFNSVYQETHGFTEKGESSFTATLNMVRTDNGWVMADLMRR